MEVSSGYQHDQSLPDGQRGTNLLNALSLVCQQEILAMENKDDQKIIGGVARRDPRGRFVNVQDLRFRRFVSPTPDLGNDEQEQVLYSIEASEIHASRWAGPRDSVEPRYAQFDRTTDEVHYVRAGFSDEPMEEGEGTTTGNQPANVSSYSSKYQTTEVLPRMSLDAETPVSPSDSVIFLDEYPTSSSEYTSGNLEATATTAALEGDDSRAISLCRHRCGAWFIERRYANMHEQDFCPNKAP